VARSDVNDSSREAIAAAAAAAAVGMKGKEGRKRHVSWKD
jgi:hypothetical protein